MHISDRTRALFLLLVLGLGHSASAQEPVGPGARVRVTTSASLSIEQTLALIDLAMPANDKGPGADTISVETAAGGPLIVARPGRRLDGTLVEVGDRAIVILVARTRITIPRDAIARLERVASYRSRAKAAGFGALIGLGAGAVFGLAATCDDDTWFCDAGFRALAGGTWGSVIGAVTGALLPPPPRWAAVPTSVLSAVPEPASVSAVGPTRRMTVSVGSGIAFGAPTDEIEDAARTAGFGDAPGFSRAVYPVSYTGLDVGTPYWLDAAYVVRGPWSVSFQYSRVPLGETSAFRSTPPQYLIVDYEVWTVGGMVRWQRGPWQLSAGPALFTSRSQAMGPASRDWIAHSKGGAQAEAVVRIPTRTRLFLDARAQYRLTGRLTIGPFTPFGGTITFPATDIRFNHWLVGVGPGVRL